ncbi:MAG: prolipoprotein diacylglyceryl transferase [Dehalococcoidales bacterium]|nr:prolipoprotein diacylglyceryl transferase [Dehalococcoidales bacterium]
MNGIVINIDPVIFQLGNLEIRWYTIAIITAIIVAILVAARESKRKGIPVDNIYSLLPWVLVSGIIGARLFHVIDQWGYYIANPMQIIQFQQGGLAIWGAVIGGGLSTILYSRAKHIPLGRLFDVLVPALISAQIVGRIGCIINGDAYGSVTSLPWGFIYTHPDAMIPGSLQGVPTHPYPVYEMIWNGTVLVVLLRLRHRFNKDGLLFLSYLTLYSLGRFLLTFIRQENMIVWDLQQAQILAVAMFVVSLTGFIYLFRKSTRHLKTLKEL